MRTLAALFASVPLALALSLSVGVGEAHAQTEAWSEPDTKGQGSRYALDKFGFRAGAEYRANLLYVNPVALNSESNRRVSWIEHRLRLDVGVDYLDKVRLYASADMLDGVLWGDNGTLAGGPKPNFGTNVNARSPNVTAPCVGLSGPDPLNADHYGYTLCSQEQIRFRKAYGDVVLPIGLLRVGRQAANSGTGIQAADGDGRPNRFGFSRQGNLVDRVLFATKPLEAFKPKEERDTSENRGLILALAYDRWVTDSVQLFADDVQQFDVAVRYLAPRLGPARDVFLGGYYVHRWDDANSSSINSFGLKANARFGDFHVTAEGAMNVGSTREIAVANSYITNDPVVDQQILQGGARAVVRYDKPKFTAYLEFDYASGDADPNNRTPLTQFLFAEDANVGLLLFEHVLAFQTARIAAAGTELLTRLGAPSFPSDSVYNRGAFTNAIALFPQFDIRPIRGLTLRGGVLFAFTAAPAVDPINSLLARDGNTIEDDLVNFSGGKPGNYWGTELDGRISYRYLDHFLFDLEGAVLFPGDALRDEDDGAVRSVLLQGRTTFFF
ncbi:hypothetical protein [Polyangium spumosum]|uniref:Alginate export domain-containing protein n=1 Tax=Polyangium spumosum TaxID=889282 RepID=A0A6N7PL82_9BACT|nr:hypothetical protein [Polyangium spumosum]MRG91000.1 hypothetical protein [Polyangium spumosum]